MNEKNSDNERIERLLRKTRLTGPSPRLKEQIIGEASKVWHQAPLEMSWTIPLRRLAVSAAAAVFIVWLANCSSNFMLAQWSSGTSRPTSQQPTYVETLPGIPHSLFVRRLAVVDRRSLVLDASVLNKHVESLRRALDESLQSDVAKPPAPAGGRSRLILNLPSGDSYS